MKCKNCGATLLASDTVCSICGTPVEPIQSGQAECVAPESVKRIRRVRPFSFILTIWVGFMFIAVGMLIFAVSPESTAGIGQGLMTAGAIAMLWGAGYSLVILHRAWQAVQPSTSGITPGYAVGLLFVPLFNLYWIFRCFATLAEESQRFCSYICGSSAAPDPDLQRCRPIPRKLSMITATVIVVAVPFELFFSIGFNILVGIVHISLYSFLTLNWAAFVNGIVDQVALMTAAQEKK